MVRSSKSILEDVDQQFCALVGYCRNMDEVYREKGLGVVDRLGRSALHLAVKRGNKAFVKELLESGANVDFKDEQKTTPLQLAATLNDHQIMKILLENGADPNISGRLGFTPFYEYLRELERNRPDRKDLECVRWMLQAGADPLIQDKQFHWPSLVFALQADLPWVLDVINENYSVHYTCRRNDRGEIHSLEGPAIEIENGEQYYAVNGVIVGPKVVEHPGSLRWRDILHETNPEARAVKIDRYGPEQFINDFDGATVDEDDDKILYKVNQQYWFNEPIAYLKVIDATPKSDGTHEDYYLRVPPELETVGEAVAWTFDMDPEEYDPEVET